MLWALDENIIIFLYLLYNSYSLTYHHINGTLCENETRNINIKSDDAEGSLSTTYYNVVALLA